MNDTAAECSETLDPRVQTSQELQTANIAYDKANSAHAAAREMVYLAEQGLARLADGSGGLTLDPAWQEMLNHATHRVNQEKARINSALESQKAKILTLEEQVTEAKQKYSSALRNLERISDEIHRHRSRRQSTRNDIDQSTITDTASESNASETLEEICSSNDENVREWLRKVDRPDPDTWTDIDLDYSSPEEVSFEKCSLRPRSSPDKSPPSPMESKVSAAVEMLSDDQIASLMLDAQLEAVCEKLAGVARVTRSPHSPESRL
ncbi:unnamed protein product [Leptidea sinapis]|uniref:SH3 domain-binding protein 5-like n=1 Tax=Leptidea sinapis TaxID=189913 RepID=A0A5E4Q1H5_9NEOP|nr:unnamed protein product [Leptidea sinapis]